MSPPVADAHPPAPPAWHARTAAEALADTGSGPDGLSDAEAARRLAAHGPNALRGAEPIRPWRIFLGQFRGLVIWILVGAAAVSGLVGEWVDCAAILSIVVLNALLGFHQEFSAEKSIAALRRMTAPAARVRRGGRSRGVPAAEVVPGDLLELEAGDLVAADARLLEADQLRCAEAALTGESLPVAKDAAAAVGAGAALGDRATLVYAGTAVAAGQGRAVVVATAMDTEMGRIAGLLEAAREAATPLQRQLAAFGRLLVWGCLAVVALLFVLGLWRGEPFLVLFLTAVSLAVAAVPEGLPAVVTIALAMGVLRMARRRALVRRLPAVETLGATSVICTDKTGTLTVGEMTVRRLHLDGADRQVTGEGYAPHGTILPPSGAAAPGADDAPLAWMARIMAGCGRASLAEEDGVWRVLGDPTEGALVACAAKAGVAAASLERDWPRHAEIPFDSERKRRTVVRRSPAGALVALVNGAPEPLLERCTAILTAAGVRPLADADRAFILACNAAMGGEALRVIASAYRDLGSGGIDTADPGAIERDLVFVGLAGMQDPPRPEAKAAVARCRSAGIRVVMITGDHPRTALAIGRELGLAGPGDTALTGPDLDAMDDAALGVRAPATAVYARVTAEHKLRIVRAWQAAGAVVAMTGDGVNDAPALRGADVGVAMGRTGTEVAKQASDMVVTDDDFVSIVAAVEEGRGIYDNIRKTLQYLLAGNCGELLLMAACVVAGLPVPLLPIHLLWINLVTDGLPSLCLAVDPVAADVMDRPPRPRGGRLADGRFLATMVGTGLLTSGVAMGVYLYALRTESLEVARTHAFAALVFAELFRSFGCRSEMRPVWRIGLLSNLWLAVAVVASAGLQIWSHHNALLGRFLKTGLMTVSDCVKLLAVSLIPLAVLEVVKVVRRGRCADRMRGASEVPRGDGGSH